MISLLWATLVLGLRAGIWAAGLVLGLVVALLPRLLVVVRLMASEGVRIYSRHQLEMSPARGFLALASFELILTTALGGLTWYWGEDLQGGIISIATGVVGWFLSIEMVDMRTRHSTHLEDYIQPWKH